MASQILGTVGSRIGEKLMDMLLDKIPTIPKNHDPLEVEEEVMFLKSILPDLLEIVVNAEVKEGWAKELLLTFKKFYYDGKDIVEEFETEVARRKRSDSSFSSFFSSFSFSSFRREIGKQIKVLYAELEKKKNQRERMVELMNGVKGSDSVAEGSDSVRKAVDEMLPKDFPITGRKDVESEIKHLLLNKESAVTSSASSSSSSTSSIPSDVSVLLITGMGGIGKTTLAQAIYNDREVKEYFKDFKQWVCSGDEELDPYKVMDVIIKEQTKQDTDKMSEIAKRRELRSIVEGRRFLMVLDDVWKGNDLKNRWEQLWGPLSYGAQGSWIIITTREQDVKSQICLAPIEEKTLDPLEDEECFQIFKRYAFPPNCNNIPENLQQIARSIVRERIRGVPLAAKVVGSSLRDEPEFLWEKALRTIKDTDSDIMSSLMWSYRRLPTPLKQCFAYFSVFSKDETIYGWQIIQDWMAFGYIQSTDTMRLEDVGQMYINHLLRASLLEMEKMEDGCIVRFKIHDLIHDLAMDVSDHKVVPKNKWLSTAECDGSLQHLHLEKLWSLSTTDYSHVPVSQLKTVRKLRIVENMTGQENFSDLIHLRILDLSEIALDSLPKSVCDLYNLQILVLRSCTKKLPEDMWKLVNLRKIYCTFTTTSDRINMASVTRVGELTLLQRMLFDDFCLSKNGGQCITQLQNMNQITGLSISGLRHVTNVEWARDAQLHNKVYLEWLVLDMEESEYFLDKNESKYFAEEDEDEEKESNEDLFKNLEPHQNLEELVLRNYQGDELPAWMGGSPLNLEKLTLKDCRLNKLHVGSHFRNLHRLSLSCIWKLKSLHIRALPSLNTLDIEKCGNLEEILLSDLPSLNTLYIEKCGNLEEFLLSDLPLLNSLRLLNCRYPKEVKESHALQNVEFLETDSWEIIREIDPHKLSDVELKDFDFDLVMWFNDRKWFRNLSSIHSIGIESRKVRWDSNPMRAFEDAPILAMHDVHNPVFVWCELDSNPIQAYEIVQEFRATSWECLRAVDPHKLTHLTLFDLNFDLVNVDVQWLTSWFQNLSSIDTIKITHGRAISFPSFLDLRNLNSLQRLRIDGRYPFKSIIDLVALLPSSLKKGPRLHFGATSRF